MRSLDEHSGGVRTKADIVAEISYQLGIEPPHMSTGSTEPKALFTAVNEQLGLGLDDELGKPDLARAIVEAAGMHWAPDYESRGATVTANGLEAVAAAVRFFTNV
jgi:hypothetical protein